MRQVHIDYCAFDRVTKEKLDSPEIARAPIKVDLVRRSECIPSNRAVPARRLAATAAAARFGSGRTS
jgi:hypothetical protein